MNISNVLTPEVMGKLNLPTDTAICLPNLAYTSTDYLQEEVIMLFAQDWVCIGVEDQVPKPGDVRPLMVVGQPLLLVRNGLGNIKVFHNVCRHRGMQLVSEPQCKQAVLMCPYHAWTYNLDGELKKTPHFGGYYNDEAPGFDKSQYPLQSVRAEVWNHMIFVNLSGLAKPLSDLLQPLAQYWKDYDFSLLRYTGNCKFEVKTNWKLAVENFVESYHLPWTHPSLNSYSKLQDHYIMMEPTYMGQGSLNYDVVTAGFPGLPVFPNLPGDRQKIAEYPYIMPNTMLGIHPNHFFVLTVQPIAPGEIIEEFHFYFVGDAAMTDELADERDRVIDIWKRINIEDIRVIEGMQVGRSSTGYQNGRFSPYHETTTHELQRRLANRLVSID